MKLHSQLQFERFRVLPKTRDVFFSFLRLCEPAPREIKTKNRHPRGHERPKYEHTSFNVNEKVRARRVYLKTKLSYLAKWVQFCWRLRSTVRTDVQKNSVLERYCSRVGFVLILFYTFCLALRQLLGTKKQGLRDLRLRHEHTRDFFFFRF